MMKPVIILIVLLIVSFAAY
ncbi:TPA: type I toxin-antitoxin system Ibs family toxin [Escherichia coli]|nr:type I toxin-antitoxin system Ibs family toxin [Escherichia coli]KAB1191900.1 type I toxin-antitoxin system Ibs family toxin [Escherichia coli]HCJ8509075.1 type I toxin-antitoxin system Ibs family toxin [Escherichia coli]HCJ9836357.1 type I toxin-antitoxin system Ibs family toxin [Escherichia coli]HCJ9886861.1 type I toxin-antitoxin system Ibs family toxin [Escherichia coli]